MLSRILVLVFLISPIVLSQNPPTSSTESDKHYPKLMYAEVPLYPPLAETAHISGTVKIEITVDGGAVVNAQIKSVEIQIADPENRAAYNEQARLLVSPSLSTPSLANVKTWKFESGPRTTFLVTYVYQIEGKQTSLPESPRIELDLPVLVKVTARPFRPTCNGCDR